MAELEDTTTWHLLEQRQRFRESLIWRLQHNYFTARGVEAWRQGEVPHYVTSNPTIANAYAEIMLALRRDLQRLASVARRKKRGDSDKGPEPLTIVELGAGSGRFAFHFLKRLEVLCAEAGVGPRPFRYVLTDVADGNLEFWRRHPNFQPFFADGSLDVARFDIMQPGDLMLQVSGKTISRDSLRGPLVVIANYLFDSVPPDLFRFYDGRVEQCLVSLAVNEDPATLDAAELLAKLAVHYDYAPVGEPPFEEPALQQILAEYQQSFSDTHLLFPTAGLRCLQALAALSQRGLVLLSADKGEHRLAALDGRPPPGLVRHGSVSLPVNYHAFTRFCELNGGLALAPSRRHRSIDVIALLMFPAAERCVETRRAYQRHVQDFGPDDFYTITKHARQYIPNMSAEDILAYLRLFRHDSHQFGRYLPRLQELAGSFDWATGEDVAGAIEKVWEMYFPLGEDLDLANRIGGLLYAMDRYEGALLYFERSIAIYGRDSGTLFNIAACRHLLGQDALAVPLLGMLLKHDPDNREGAILLAEIQAGQQASTG